MSLTNKVKSIYSRESCMQLAGKKKKSKKNSCFRYSFTSYVYGSLTWFILKYSFGLALYCTSGSVCEREECVLSIHYYRVNSSTEVLLQLLQQVSLSSIQLLLCKAGINNAYSLSSFVLVYALSCCMLVVC